jgi:hypothetical protein
LRKRSRRLKSQRRNLKNKKDVKMASEVQLILTLVITVGVGMIIIALVKYIFNREKGLMMTKQEHILDCNKAKENIRVVIKEELADLKEFFAIQVDNKILKELREINDRK